MPNFDDDVKPSFSFISNRLRGARRTAHWTDPQASRGPCVCSYPTQVTTLAPDGLGAVKSNPALLKSDPKVSAGNTGPPAWARSARSIKFPDQAARSGSLSPVRRYLSISSWIVVRVAVIGTFRGAVQRLAEGLEHDAIPVQGFRVLCEDRRKVPTESQIRTCLGDSKVDAD